MRETEGKKERRKEEGRGRVGGKEEYSKTERERKAERKGKKETERNDAK